MAGSLFCLSTDEDCTNDAAVNALSNIYGSNFVQAFIHGNPSTATPSSADIAPIILGSLANAAGIVAIFMAIAIAVVALINSAQDGEAFGKGSAGYIITGRMLLSGILLFPTASGYCVVQIILMFIILGSNAATNYIYQKVVQASAIGNVSNGQAFTSTTDINALTAQDVYGVRGFALAHFQQAYCVNLLNQNYGSSTEPLAQSTPRTFPDSTVNISDIYVPSAHSVVGAIISQDRQESGESSKGTYYNLTHLTDKTGILAPKDRPICGSLKIHYPSKASYTEFTENLTQSELANTLGLREETQRDIYEKISNASVEIAINKRAILMGTTGLVTDWMNTQNFPYDVTDPNYTVAMESVNFQSLQTIIKAQQQKAAIEYIQVMQNNDMAALISDLVDALTAKGWTYAGGIKQRIISNSSPTKDKYGSPSDFYH